jgi:hypothetical protein
MNNLNIYKIAAVFILSAVLILPGAAFAKTHTATIEGTIEGALCVLSGKKCPQDDLDTHLLIENNFVLLSPDGKYYYLPNISRKVKLRYVGKVIRITGQVKGESIIVDTFEAKEGGKYKPIWSKEKQKREFINYFETLPAG